MSWPVYACLGLGLLAALVGGVLQSFSDFVMKGLLQAQSAGGMESMQQLRTLGAWGSPRACLGVFAF